MECEQCKNVTWECGCIVCKICGTRYIDCGDIDHSPWENGRLVY